MANKEYSPSDIEKILKEEKKVILASGFTATQAEIDWAKEEIANSPKGVYRSIAEAIAVKRGLDQFERGEYKLASQFFKA